jgi:spore coat protein CotH
MAHIADKSLIRNVLIYNLSNQIGRYATKTKFYNLDINNQFLGVYVLMEKIKRDKNRVDISKNKAEDISGGYIIKIDKPTGDGDSFNSDIAFMSEYTSGGVKGLNKNPVFLYEYPKNDDISNDQKQYIQNYMQGFENALASEDFKSLEDGYRQFINVDTFIDFFILNEITRNVDGYRISTFMNKDKGGKLNMGPSGILILHLEMQIIVEES